MKRHWIFLVSVFALVVAIVVWRAGEERTSYVKNGRLNEELGWGRRIYVDLSLGDTLLPIGDLVKRMSGMSSGPLSGRDGQYDEIRYGLEYYQSDGALDDAYVYRGAGTHVLFDCSPRTTVPGCTGRWHY